MDRKKKDYALNLFSPILLGQAPLGDISGIAEDWDRNITSKGAWLGSFTIKDLTRSELERWFYEMLGYHLEESVAGLNTWTGQIYEMDLVLNGHRKRRTLEHYDDDNAMANWMKVSYIDDSNAPQNTGPWSQVQSVARYGQIQEYLRLDGYALAAVQARLGTELERRAWPFAQTISLSQKDTQGDRLEMRAWGYIHTMNYRFVTSADGNTGNVSAWISSIINTDCEFVDVGAIRTNTVQVKRSVSTPIRALDKLKELSELGDASYNPWRLWVNNKRLAIYEQMSAVPVYYWDNGEILDRNRRLVHPRMVVPGVIRDLNYPQGRTEPDAFLTDSRDSWLEEVSVGPDGKLTLINSTFSDAHILAVQAEFRQREE